MAEFKVSWVVELEADNPREAALTALEFMQDPRTTATQFDVTDRSGNRVEIDLND